MVKILELKEEIQSLYSLLNEQESVWFPVWIDHEKHPVTNDLSFIYIRVGNDDYLLPVSHSETIGADKRVVSMLISNGKPKWMFQTKRFLHSLDKNDDYPTIYDVDSNYFLQTGQTINYDKYIDPLLSEWIRKGYKDNLPTSIPIYRWTTALRSLVLDYSSYYTTIHSDFNWYNSYVIPILSQIERNGVGVDSEKFLDRFGEAHLKHVTEQNRIYTEYNPFVVTGRPSSRHGGINFAALNKSDGTRKCFIPSYRFILMDYDAYHIRLIGKLIGYRLPKESAHQWLADQYGMDYESAKKTTFRLLYGGIDDEFKDIPFFEQTDRYIQRLWKDTEQNGYLRTTRRKIPLEWIEEPNPQKVFNYLLQATETERNIIILKSVMGFINDRPINLALYNYDSFLFDVPPTITKSDLTGLQSVLQEGGFPVKISSGMNFDEV